MLQQRIPRFFLIGVFLLLLFLVLPNPVSNAAEDETSLVWVHLSAGSDSSMQIQLHGNYCINEHTVHNGILNLQITSGGIEITHDLDGSLGILPSISLTREDPTSWNSYLSLKNNLYGNCNYLGNLSISIKDSSSFDIVNIVSLDQYICGILSTALSDNAPAESLKALAVATRSLVLSNLGGNSSFDFEDFETSLEYSGYDLYCKNILNAVQEVRNEVMVHNKKILPCYFCVSNGGYGIRPEDRWDLPASGSTPYLDTYDPYDLVSNSKTVYYTLPADLSLASRETTEFFLNCLKQGQGFLRSAKITSVEPFYRAENGVCFESETTLPVWLRVTILHPSENEETEIEFPLEAFVQSGVVHAPSANTCFLLHKGENGWTFVFSCSLGHRVGMSCSGMHHLAQLGRSYPEILSYYYPGATLEKLQQIDEFSK